MENPGDFVINCPNCDSTLRGEGDVLADGWLYTCANCEQQSIVTDEALLEAKRAGHKTVTGRPLVSGGKSLKSGSPLVRNAMFSGNQQEPLRSTKQTKESPLVRNARMRAEREV